MSNRTQKSTGENKQVHVQSPKDIAVKPVYTIEEFVKAPDEIGNYSADIISAALTKDGSESYTIEDAKAIVKRFAAKEVN